MSGQTVARHRSRRIAAAGGGDNWMISETTSPVDYTPIVTAIAFSRGGADGSLMQLAIYCRGGRTELVVAGPAVAGNGEDYAISYRINDGQPVQLAAGRHRLEPAPRSRAISCACCSRSPRRAHRRPHLPPSGCRP